MKSIVSTFTSLLENQQDSKMSKWQMDQLDSRREEIERLQQLNSFQRKMNNIAKKKGESVSEYEKPLKKFFSLTHWNVKKRNEITFLLLDGLESPEMIYDLIYLQSYCNDNPEEADIGQGFKSLDWILRSAFRKAKAGENNFELLLEEMLEPLLESVDKRINPSQRSLT